MIQEWELCLTLTCGASMSCYIAKDLPEHLTAYKPLDEAKQSSSGKVLNALIGCMP